MVSAKRRLIDLLRGGVDGVSTFGNETVSGGGDFLAFFAGEGVLFGLVVGEEDLFDLVGEEDLLFVCRWGWGIYAMTSKIPCFCSEVKETWTSGELESSSNSPME